MDEQAPMITTEHPMYVENPSLSTKKRGCLLALFLSLFSRGRQPFADARRDESPAAKHCLPLENSTDRLQKNTMTKKKLKM